MSSRENTLKSDCYSLHVTLISDLQCSGSLFYRYPNMAALPHRTFTTAVTYRDSCAVQDTRNIKRNALYL